MLFTKPIRTMVVNHKVGDADVVPQGNPSDIAFYEFERGETVDVGDGKKVPFHAIDMVETARTAETDTRADAHCPPSCGTMGEPIIYGDMPEIDVLPGEEFDPLDGITAKDSNGEVIPVEVSVEGA